MSYTVTINELDYSTEFTLDEVERLQEAGFNLLRTHWLVAQDFEFRASSALNHLREETDYGYWGTSLWDGSYVLNTLGKLTDTIKACVQAPYALIRIKY